MVQWTGLQCVFVAFPAHTHMHINDLLYVAHYMGLDASKSVFVGGGGGVNNKGAV